MSPTMERIYTVLGAMRTQPRPLRGYLRQPGPDFEVAQDTEIVGLLALLLSDDPNHPARLQFSSLLREWDNVKEAEWTSGTARNSEDRRQQIHRLLQSDDDLRERIDSLIPFFTVEEPLVIASEHVDWYTPTPGVRDYYWSTYRRYLETIRQWPPESIASLENSTRTIVECLQNPESPSAYSSRGLVVGYVQSGKTANFTGVVARAADAGYRLIIILAGMWNILRNQTQRRLDKELLGKELLANDENYSDPVPDDWNEFLEHGFEPEERGHFRWERLTRPDIDFKRLKQAIDALEYERRDRSKPLNHPDNLHFLPVKLLVVKKHHQILRSLLRDFRQLTTRIEQLPTLIIDDESDQAGVNTVDPRRASTGGKARTETNDRIVDLLRLFPRGQYVGYTATPYANALIDPNDPEDLFPKDFFISLDRPTHHYMGVSDFFDPRTDYADLDHDDYSQREIAFIRRVADPIGEDDVALSAALRSYVLAGAVKLYRQDADPRRYRFRTIRC